MSTFLAIAALTSRILTGATVVGLLLHALFSGDASARKPSPQETVRSESRSGAGTADVSKSPVALVNRSLRVTSWGFGD